MRLAAGGDEALELLGVHGARGAGLEGDGLAQVELGEEASIVIMPMAPPIWIWAGIWCVLPSRMRLRTPGVAMSSS